MDVEQIAQMLISQEKTVSVAEADTCGLVGYMLSTVPGSSKYFPGGVIAYTGGLKQKVLGVSDELYNNKGSVSSEMAVAMAAGVRELTAHGLRRLGDRRCRPHRRPLGPSHRHLLRWSGGSRRSRGRRAGPHGCRRPRRQQAAGGPGRFRPARPEPGQRLGSREHQAILEL